MRSGCFKFSHPNLRILKGKRGFRSASIPFNQRRHSLFRAELGKH
jgi:hypothetical protein